MAVRDAEIARLTQELALQKGANFAQDERERQAAARLGMDHSCDWPDDVAEKLLGQRDALAAATEREREVRELIQRMRTEPVEWDSVAYFADMLDAALAQTEGR